MWTWLLSPDGVDRLVPPGLLAGFAARDARRARALLQFVALVVAAGMLLGTLHLATGEVAVGAWTLLLFPTLAAVPWVLIRTRSIELANDVQCALGVAAVLATAAASGGHRSVVLLCLAVCPPLTVAFSNASRASMWSGVSAGVALAFEVAALMELPFPELLAALATPNNQAPTALMLVIVTAGLSSSFAREQDETEAEVLASVSELEAANAQLEAARSEAVLSNEAKEAFLANVSHEMRTPLAAILGLTELLHDEQLGGVARAYVDEINHSGRALLHIIDDLLDAVRAQRDELTLRYVAFDLRDLCEDARGAVAGAAWRKGVALGLELAPDLEGRFHGDPDRLRQVLINLLNNAVKFTERGRIDLTVRAIGTRRVRFEVRDTGIGMPQRALSRIFERFSQADESWARRHGGTGLGLAISKSIVDRMGGEIGVQSVEGEGSTFHFVVPLSRLGASLREPVWSGTIGIKIGDGALRRELIAHLQALGASVVDLDAQADVAAAFVDEAHADHPRASSRPSFVLIPMGRTAADLPPGARRVMVPVRRHAIREILAGVHARTPTPLPRPAGEPGRVLIVDDNEVNRLVARRLVERLGWKVDEAASGPQAVELARAVPFDLVLMDCQMPEMDGYEATRLIRQHLGPTLPVVALTAGALAKDRERAIAAGMCDVLTKPIELKKLTAVLDRFHRAELA